MVVTRLIVAALLTGLVACTGTDAPQKPAATEESRSLERWQTLDTEISKLRVFIRSRAEFLESSRTTMSDAERAGLAEASAALGEMESLWNSASSDFLAGDVTSAVKQGENVRSKAREALKSLGIDPGKP